MSSTRRHLTNIGLLVVLSFVFVACTPQATPTTAPTAFVAPTAALEKATEIPAPTTQVAEKPDKTPATPSEAAPAEQPLIMTAAIQFEIKNADPAISTDWPGAVFTRATYDTLVELHGDPVKTEPGLAEKWEMSNDLMQWTFYLTDEAVFHDGTPVTAAAVKYTFDRQMAMKTGYAWMWSDISNADTVTVIDDHTIKFTLTKPFAPFLQTLTYLPIVNPQVVKQHEVNGDWGTNWLLDHEAGSGPFTLTRWEPGSLYEFTKFPSYWKPFPSKTNPTVFRYVVYREPGPAALGLQTGDVSWSSYIEEAEAEQLKNSGKAESVVRPSMSIDYIYMNTQSKGPIGDVNVRKAIAYAFDYAAGFAAMYGMEPTNSIIPLGLPGAIEIPDAQRTDLAAAKAALAQSQWPNGGFSLDYVYIGGFAPEETAGLILLQSLQQLNITVKSVPKTWSEMVQMCGSLDTSPDMINVYTNPPYPDPYSLFLQNWGPTTTYDYNTCSWFFDPQVAELLKQAASEPDEAKRHDYYAQIQKILWDARFGIVLGNAAHPEGRNLHWEPIQTLNPIFGYLDYIQNYQYMP